MMWARLGVFSENFGGGGGGCREDEPIRGFVFCLEEKPERL